MLKKFFVILAIALAVILVFCWIYLPSFSRFHELKQEKEKLSKRIQEIDSQIKTLADEKYLLQNDVTYLEKVIREELGFVKPGEIIYEMITKKNAGTAAPSAVTNGSSSSNSTLSTSLAAQSTTGQKVSSSENQVSSPRKVRAPSTKTYSAKRRPRQL